MTFQLEEFPDSRTIPEWRCSLGDKEGPIISQLRYKEIWEVAVGEVLMCEREPHNVQD